MTETYLRCSEIGANEARNQDRGEEIAVRLERLREQTLWLTACCRRMLLMIVSQHAVELEDQGVEQGGETCGGYVGSLMLGVGRCSHCKRFNNEQTVSKLCESAESLQLGEEESEETKSEHEDRKKFIEQQGHACKLDDFLRS